MSFTLPWSRLQMRSLSFAAPTSYSLNAPRPRPLSSECRKRQSQSHICERRLGCLDRTGPQLHRDLRYLTSSGGLVRPRRQTHLHRVLAHLLLRFPDGGADVIRYLLRDLRSDLHTRVGAKPEVVISREMRLREPLLHHAIVGAHEPISQCRSATEALKTSSARATP